MGIANVPSIEFRHSGPMAVSEVLTVNLPQLTSVIVAYILAIKYCNLSSAAISQLITIEFVLGHVTLHLAIWTTPDSGLPRPRYWACEPPT